MILELQRLKMEKRGMKKVIGIGVMLLE